jgi:integrase
MPHGEWHIDARRPTYMADLASRCQPLATRCKSLDRLIAVFVLLLGQSLSRIVALTRDHVDLSDTATRLLLADDDWIELPEPIATLLRSYLDDGWNTRTAANAGTNWLFPGGMPSQHLHIHRASDALRTAGIPVLAARNSTWLQLVREAPPAVLARTLGISPRTAVQHATRAGTDYQLYAASRAREEQN